MLFTTALLAAKRSMMYGAALAGLAVGGSAFAANTTFTAGGSALWTTAGNWSGGAPTASDVAVFGTGTGSIVRVSGTTLAVSGLVFNNTNAVQRHAVRHDCHEQRLGERGLGHRAHSAVLQHGGCCSCGAGGLSPRLVLFHGEKHRDTQPLV